MTPRSRTTPTEASRLSPPRPPCNIAYSDRALLKYVLLLLYQRLSTGYEIIATAKIGIELTTTAFLVHWCYISAPYRDITCRNELILRLHSRSLTTITGQCPSKKMPRRPFAGKDCSNRTQRKDVLTPIAGTIVCSSFSVPAHER